MGPDNTSDGCDKNFSGPIFTPSWRIYFSSRRRHFRVNEGILMRLVQLQVLFLHRWRPYVDSITPSATYLRQLRHILGNLQHAFWDVCKRVFKWRTHTVYVLRVIRNCFFVSFNPFDKYFLPAPFLGCFSTILVLGGRLALVFLTFIGDRGFFER